ncbi:MAG TPA: AsmA-like C-terminal region-containing protein [Xanthobacteraceae bacterium]|nr:AsmA-like C-terminal region-containing protein [Xanthobacteraceae bacterium]
MQSTLIGSAVVLIVALVAALVGPLFIDWGRWRPNFEAEATRLVGMPVRVSGRIEARLLPTPSLQLTGIEVGEAGHEPRLRARSLGVQFALGSLLRGEWRASQLQIEAPQVNLGVDAGGHVEVPRVAIGFDPDQLSFDRIEIQDGRAVLLDAASGTRAELDQVWFKGDMRSLLGPFRGEGAFVSAGRLYGYRVSGSRRGDDGGMRMRLSLSVNPTAHPLSVETDGVLRLESSRPRYDGTLTLAGPASAAAAAGATPATDPWRATSHVKVTPAGALFEDVDLQYGPDDHALKLAGTADFAFGAKPSVAAVLSARQLDLDRAALLPDAAPRTPVALLRRMADTLAQFAHPPLPVKIGVGIDTATLGGGSLIGLRGDMHAEADGWSIDNIEFRAPGATQVRASGLLSRRQSAVEFSGPASLDSADPKALIAWLEGRTDMPRATIGALSLRGDVTLGATQLAVERFKAKLDGKAVEGRLAYEFATDRSPARLDAALNAAQIDLDGTLAFAGNALAGTAIAWPREIALKLDFGRATYLGVEAKGAHADLRLGPQGLDIEHLAIADFGGAVVDAQGHIDAVSPSWRGSMTLGLQAQQLAGMAAIAAKLAPGSTDLLQALARRAAPARLTAKLDVAPAPDSGDAKTKARLTVDGAVAGVRVNLTAQGGGDAASPAAADLHLDGRLDADDGANLAALVGLDRLAVVDHRAASLVLSVDGPANGELRVDGSFTGEGLDAGARGLLRVADAQAHGALAVRFAAAHARWPLRNPAAAALPVALTTKLSVDGDRLTFDALDGHVADAALKGQIGLVLGQPLRIDGHLDADTIDAAAVLAAALGAPTHAAAAWSDEPFGPGPFASLEGQIAFTAARASFIAGIVGAKLQGTVRFAPSAILLEKIEGRVGGGKLAAQADLHATSAGLAAKMQVSLDDADLAALLPRDAGAAGRLSLQLDASGAGLSPAALVGALQGQGSVAGENLQIGALDPAAFDAAVTAADHGVLLDPVRIGDVVRTALADGRLEIPDVGGAVAISHGRLTIAPLLAPAQGADVTIRGSYDLGADKLDLGFDLAGAPRADAANGARPRLAVSFTGPLAAPRRSLDVAALVDWLTARRDARQKKQLEAAEREAKRIQAAEAEALRRAQEEARQAAERAAQRAAEQAALPTTSSVAPNGDRAPADKAPDLPPAIEIKPAPVVPAPALAPRPRRPPVRRTATPRPVAPPLVITPTDPH